MEEESKEGFKRCGKCGRFLPLADFNKMKSSKDGLQNYCKDCQKEMYAEWYAHNKEAIADYKAQYRQANKEAIADYQAQYRQANKEAIAQKKAKYYQENKEAIAQKNAQYYQENKEAIAQKAAEYRANNKEAIAQKNAQYYQENKEAIADYQAEWRNLNKEKIAEYQAEWYNPQTHPLNWAKSIVNNYKKMDRQRGFNDKETITAEWFLDNIAYKPCAHCGVQGIGKVGCNRLDNTKGHTIDNVESCCLKCNSRENMRDQIRRGIHVSCKHKKQSFSDFVNEHLKEKSKK